MIANERDQMSWLPSNQRRKLINESGKVGGNTAGTELEVRVNRRIVDSVEGGANKQRIETLAAKIDGGVRFSRERFV